MNGPLSQEFMEVPKRALHCCNVCERNVLGTDQHLSYCVFCYSSKLIYLWKFRQSTPFSLIHFIYFQTRGNARGSA